MFTYNRLRPQQHSNTISCNGSNTATPAKSYEEGCDGSSTATPEGGKDGEEGKD
jgi:expansin (peptidoglycan-binding protein)